MKHTTPVEKKIGEYVFYIYPFSAFKSANIGGELISVISPILVSVLPALAGNKENEDEMESIFDMDISKAMPSIINACSILDGDKLEHILKYLICKNQNIAYEIEGDEEVSWLKENIADSIFCGCIEDMFILAFEVIKLNFKGFFKNLGNLYGKQDELLSQMKNLKNTDTSTAADSAI